MADAAQIDIIADRNVDHFEAWSFLAVDWTGSSFAIQVRAVKDTTGTPLLEENSAGGSFAITVITATVGVHVSAGRLTTEIYGLVNPATGVFYVAGDNLLLSYLTMGINAAAMQAFPFPDERGDDPVFYYDIIRTPLVGSAEVILRGKFTVRAGVTIP